MSITIKFSDLGDLTRQMTGILGLAASQKNIADLLRPASMLFSEAWQRAAPISKRGVKGGKNPHAAGALRKNIFGGRVARGARSGHVMVFAAVDRKKAPQADWINRGTKRQAPDPTVFTRPFRQVRPIARAMVKAGMARLVAMFGRVR